MAMTMNGEYQLAVSRETVWAMADEFFKKFAAAVNPQSS